MRRSFLPKKQVTRITPPQPLLLLLNLVEATLNYWYKRNNILDRWLLDNITKYLTQFSTKPIITNCIDDFCKQPRISFALNNRLQLIPKCQKLSRRELFANICWRVTLNLLFKVSASTFRASNS